MTHDPTATDVLKKIAPSMAIWPRFMRRLPAAALWTAVTLLFTAASGLFWRTVTLSSDSQRIEKIDSRLDAYERVLEQLSKDTAVVKSQTSTLMSDRENQVWVLQADYNRRHHLPLPPPPKSREP